MNITKRLAQIVALAATLAIVPCAGFAATVWDLANDFSTSTNPNGVWTYGTTPTLNGAFTLFTTSFNHGGLQIWASVPEVLPIVGYNPTGSLINAYGTVVVPANSTLLHPGAAGEYAVVQWTAPAAGDYNLSTLFSPLDVVGTTTDVHVFSGSTELFGGFVTGVYGSSNSQAYSNILTGLNTGDVLSFAVGKNANGNANDYYYDSTGLKVNITSVPEPGVMTMLTGLMSAGTLFSFRRLKRS